MARLLAVIGVMYILYGELKRKEAQALSFSTTVKRSVVAARGLPKTPRSAQLPVDNGVGRGLKFLSFSY